MKGELVKCKKDIKEKLIKLTEKKDLLQFIYRHGVNLLKNQEVLTLILYKYKEDKKIKNFIAKASPLIIHNLNLELRGKVIRTVKEQITFFFEENNDYELSSILKVFTYCCFFFKNCNIQEELEEIEKIISPETGELPLTAIAFVECVAKAAVGDPEVFEKILNISTIVFEEAAEKEDSLIAYHLSFVLADVVAKFHKSEIGQISGLLIKGIERLHEPRGCLRWQIVEYFSKIYLEALLKILKSGVVDKETTKSIIGSLNQIEFMYTRKLACVISEILNICNQKYYIEPPENLQNIANGFKRPNTKRHSLISRGSSYKSYSSNSKKENTWKNYWETLSEYIVESFFKGVSLEKMEYALKEVINKDPGYLKINNYECCFSFFKPYSEEPLCFTNNLKLTHKKTR